MSYHKRYLSIGITVNYEFSELIGSIIYSDGKRIFDIKDSISVGFSQELSERYLLLKSKLFSIYSKEDCKDAFLKKIRKEEPIRREMLELSNETNLWYIQTISSLIEISEAPPTLIGINFVEVFYSTNLSDVPRFSIQIGNPVTIANALKIQVIHDFDCNDFFYGGAGKPLSPILYPSMINYSKSLRGISVNFRNTTVVIEVDDFFNITTIHKGELLGALKVVPSIKFLIRNFIKFWNEESMNFGAQLINGLIDNTFLNKWLSNKIFLKKPKMEEFIDYVSACISEIIDKDTSQNILITVLSFIHNSVIKYISNAINGVLRNESDCMVVLVGRNNFDKNLVESIKLKFKQVIFSDELKWKDRGIEAVLYAFLATRSILNLPITFNETTGTCRPSIGGLITKPD